jgi:hypothetical protein
MTAKQRPCLRCLLSTAHDVPYACRQDAQQPARASTRIKDLEVKVLSKRDAEYAAAMQVGATPCGAQHAACSAFTNLLAALCRVLWHSIRCSMLLVISKACSVLYYKGCMSIGLTCGMCACTHRRQSVSHCLNSLQPHTQHHSRSCPAVSTCFHAHTYCPANHASSGCDACIYVARAQCLPQPVQLSTGEFNQCASRCFAVCRCDCAEAGQGVQTERAAELLVRLALPVQARLPRK